MEREGGWRDKEVGDRRWQETGGMVVRDNGKRGGEVGGEVWVWGGRGGGGGETDHWGESASERGAEAEGRRSRNASVWSEQSGPGTTAVEGRDTQTGRRADTNTGRHRDWGGLQTHWTDRDVT